MMSTLPLLIPGADEGAGCLDVHNPYDLSLIGKVATADSRHIDKALSTAYGLLTDRDK